jgi:hypothetical protein
MSTSEIAQAVESMANVSWWKVLKRQWGEVDELRKQERECWSVVGKLRRAGDDYQTLIEQAESIGREADIIAALWRRQWRVYWDAVNAIRSDFPELLELFPYADGIEHDDIDPKAAAKAMQGLAGKILARADSDDPWVKVTNKDCNKVDRSVLFRDAGSDDKPWVRKVSRGVFEVRKSKLHRYQS